MVEKIKKQDFCYSAAFCVVFLLTGLHCLMDFQQQELLEYPW